MVVAVSVIGTFMSGLGLFFLKIFYGMAKDVGEIKVSMSKMTSEHNSLEKRVEFLEEHAITKN